MERLDLTRIKRVPIASRESKVRVGDLAQVPRPGASFAEFYNSLPDILKARELRLLVEKIAEAVRENKPRIVLFGAHVIKCGLSPYLIEGMKRGIWTTFATNGAGSIHDFEIAVQGATSEDVGRGLADGTFGMAEETGRWMNEAIRDGSESGWGFGESIARKMESLQLPYRDYSILYNAFQSEIPMCVHVALGTDIIHQHPEASGSAIGETSFRDFRKITDCVAELRGGGVVLNLGSAVILPEVFLKALTVARNLVEGVHGFTTANFDMFQAYRPCHNIVSRPTETGGTGLTFTGHHELLLPFFFYAVFEACKPQSQLF